MMSCTAGQEPTASTSSASAQLLEVVQGCLSESGQECLDALTGTAAVLSLKDVSPAAMLLAALEAVSAAQETQDGEEQVYDTIKQLEAQAEVASALLSSLNTALSELERASVKAAVEAEAHRHKAPEELAKVDKYRAQQRQYAARLQELGYEDKLSHGALLSLGQQHMELTAELKAAEAQAQRYLGLPADLGAAKAVHLERLQELEKLKERLAAGLAVL